jgi:hypothetical protein
MTGLRGMPQYPSSRVLHGRFKSGAEKEEKRESVSNIAVLQIVAVFTEERASVISAGTVSYGCSLRCVAAA